MFYGRQKSAGAAEAGGTIVTIHAAGAGGGAAVPPIDAGGVAAQSGSIGRDCADGGAKVFSLRPNHAPQGYSSGIVAGPVWQTQRTGFAFRVSSLSHAVSATAGSAGSGTGRVSGSLARLLAVLAAVAPYPLAARLAWLLLGVEVNAMNVWRAAQRLGQAAADYSEGLSDYPADSRSRSIVNPDAPQTVALSVDGCALGMQVRRRRRKDGEKLTPLPAVADGHFREVKTGVWLLPEERVESSPGRHCLVRRFLVSCLGDADEIFRRLNG